MMRCVTSRTGLANIGEADFVVRVDKVVALIVRQGPAGLEIVVFDHPPAGQQAGTSVQLPAGTVEECEAPSDAVLREAWEETGIEGLSLRRNLGSLPVLGPSDWMVTRVISGTHLCRGYAIHESGDAAPACEIAVAEGDWRGSVPLDALTKDSTRHLYELSLTGGAPEQWEHACDCGATLRLYWSSTENTTLDERQQPWLDAAKRAMP